jgi:hypothetical protein
MRLNVVFAAKLTAAAGNPIEQNLYIIINPFFGQQIRN